MSLRRFYQLHLLGPCIDATHINAQHSSNHLFPFSGEVTLLSEEILVKLFEGKC